MGRGRGRRPPGVAWRWYVEPCVRRGRQAVSCRRHRALRARSTPLFSMRTHTQEDRRASGDNEQLVERLMEWRVEEGPEAAAAGRLQRWWRTERRVDQAAVALLGERKRLNRWVGGRGTAGGRGSSLHAPFCN